VAKLTCDRIYLRGPNCIEFLERSPA